LGVLLVIAVVFTGCNPFYGKNITINKGIAHFYFERPDGCEVYRTDIYDEPDLKFTYINLSGPPEGEKNNRIIPLMVFYN
jgi:hypothetical protein